MVLLDSNIIIYLRDPAFGPKIIKMLGTQDAWTCNIVVAEVLGFKGLTDGDVQFFSSLFATMKHHPFDAPVTQAVIDIRRSQVIGLPDAIIAATAVVNNIVLWTHNTDDFRHIPKLQLFDPLSA